MPNLESPAPVATDSMEDVVMSMCVYRYKYPPIITGGIEVIFLGAGTASEGYQTSTSVAHR